MTASITRPASGHAPTDDPGAASRRTVAHTARRRTAGLVVAVVAVALLTLLSVLLGSKNIPLPVVIESLGNNTGRGDAYVVWSLRIPRTVIGITVGLALAVAGALIQALTRNPLADPGILGVNAGAAFFVALGISVFGVTSIRGYMWFAFLGALVVTAAVYVIGSSGRRGADPVQLTLAGVAIGAVLSGLVTAMVLLDAQAFNQMRHWNVGSIVNRNWDVLVPVLPFLVVGVLLAAVAAASLNAIALGDDHARSLGTSVVRTRIVVVLAVTLLAGGATAIAGPIGFVGLMIPHVARWIVGPDQRWIIAYSLLLGPALMLVSDLAGRMVMRPGELPVGVVTAFVGAPILVLLVRRKKASGL